MSNLVCPDCGSDNVMTERRPDGYHICRKCCFYWRNEKAPKQTVFHRITQSPEVLAEKLVFLECIDRMWHSTIFPYPENPYPTREEAIAATVAKLKEVAE